MIAIAIIIIVLTFILGYNSIKQEESSLQVLQELQSDHEFRECAIAQDYNCTQKLIDEKLPLTHNYTLQLTKDKAVHPVELPNKNVFVDQYLIAGTITNDDWVLVKLFYWKK